MAKRKRGEREHDLLNSKNIKRTKTESTRNASLIADHGTLRHENGVVDAGSKIDKAAQRKARRQKKALKKALTEEQSRAQENKFVQIPVTSQDKQKNRHRKRKRHREVATQSNENLVAGQEREAPFEDREDIQPNAYNAKSTTGSPKWKLSDVIGGQMLDIDPIFTLEEE